MSNKNHMCKSCFEISFYPEFIQLPLWVCGCTGGGGGGGGYSLYNGIRGYAANLGMGFITFGIALGYGFRDFGIILGHQITKCGIDLCQKLRKSGGFQNLRQVCRKIKPYTSGVFGFKQIFCCSDTRWSTYVISRDSNDRVYVLF